MVEVPSHIQAGNVEDLVSQLDRSYRSSPDSVIPLDLSGVVSIARPAGVVLSNALLTQLTAAHLDVTAPAQEPVSKLTSAGLGFAFAHRLGETDFHNVDEEALQLDRWRLPWTPAGRQLEFMLEEDRPSIAQKTLAAFINPHATAKRHNRRDVPNRVQNWLSTVLPPRAMGEATGDRRSFGEELHDLVYELVENVTEHAWPVGQPEPKSMVQVSVARGNNATTRDRIWVVVMDTGPGIVSTAAPKVDGDKLPGEKLLEGLLQGAFVQTDNRARGLGLPRVVRICGRWKDSEVQILTDQYRIAIHEGRKPTIEKKGWKLQGTIVIARFSTPPLPVELPDQA